LHDQWLFVETGVMNDFDWTALYAARRAWIDALQDLQSVEPAELEVLLTDAIANPDRRRYALLAMADLPHLGQLAIPAVVNEALTGQAHVGDALVVLVRVPRELVIEEIDRRCESDIESGDEWTMWRMAQLLETLGEYGRLRDWARHMQTAGDEDLREAGEDILVRLAEDAAGENSAE